MISFSVVKSGRAGCYSGKIRITAPGRVGAYQAASARLRSWKRPKQTYK